MRVDEIAQLQGADLNIAVAKAIGWIAEEIQPGAWRVRLGDMKYSCKDPFDEEKVWYSLFSGTAFDYQGSNSDTFSLLLAARKMGILGNLQPADGVLWKAGMEIVSIGQSIYWTSETPGIAICRAFLLAVNFHEIRLVECLDIKTPKRRYNP